MCDVERNLGRVALMSPFLHLLLFFNVDVLLFCESPSWFQANRRNWEVVHFLPGCEVLSFQAELRLLWQTFQSVTRIHEYKVISLREVSSHLGVIFEWPGPNGRNGKGHTFYIYWQEKFFSLRHLTRSMAYKRHRKVQTRRCILYAASPIILLQNCNKWLV